MKETYCYTDKQFVKTKDGGLPISDLGIQRGYGVFDFFRVHRKKALFLEDHLDRLYHSAKIMRLDGCITRKHLYSIIDELINLNDYEHSGMRIMLTGGDADDGYSIQNPRLSIIQNTLAPPPLELPERGIRLASYNYQRQLSEVKTTDYLMAIWLQPWMKEKKADDILYYHDQHITECPRSNIFIITQDFKLITPEHGMLSGITRKNIIRVCKKLNLALEERNIHLNEMRDAKGAFICSTTKRMMPVVKIDEIEFDLSSSRKTLETIWQELIKMEEAPF
ncbi:MAG: aminotransferase class IV [Chitinophagia bacterium]